MYKLILKPILFLFDPENAHHLTNRIGKIIFSIPLINHVTKSILAPRSQKPVTKAGITFPNPVGLAAGFDKDAKYVDILSQVGFGFLEIGTVTPVGQAGNDKPRLFRLPADDAIINRMGFNNEGVEKAVERLITFRQKNKIFIIGGNIGKNKVTPNEDAALDYQKTFTALYPYVNYFTVNVSSPNTPGLRSLQEIKPLRKILISLKEIRLKQAEYKPIFLKIAPDLTDSQIDEVVELCKEEKIEGIVATNTTIDRSDLHTDHPRLEQIGGGGLSGRPLKNRANDVVKQIRAQVPETFVIIGVGGIYSPKDAKERMEAGADLVQLYSGLIYEGPGLVKRIVEGV